MNDQISLPLEVVSPADINRLIRDLKKLDDYFIKSSTTTVNNLPPRNEFLNKLAAENSLDLLKEKGRNQLRAILEQLLKNAPRINISFASEPSLPVVNKVLGWLRDNVHQNCLLEIGLQPNLAAGCVLRTPNKVFDLSLRHHLEGQIGYLTELIQGAVSARR